MSDGFALQRGDGPLLISAPHVGVRLPPGLDPRLGEPGRTLPDTDWDVHRLYDFAGEIGATTIAARWSRYVVDLNRDPDGASLYPGARTTALCPTETFAGEPLYAPDDAPGAAEIAARRANFFEPYHAALRAELARIRARYGFALLLDAHSIWGRLPLLFEGELPAINLGTNAGRSCAPELTAAVLAVLDRSPYAHVVDGRFTGGYITRRYGDPGNAVHAVQIELNQSTYLADGSRTRWDDAKAAELSAVLRRVCDAIVAFADRVTGLSGRAAKHDSSPLS